MIYKDKKGLTIIELLVTITILVATVTTVLALGNRAVSNAGLFASYAKATFLAKEGMEIVEQESSIRGIENIGTTYFVVDYKNNIEDKSETDCYRELKINNEGFYAIGAPEDKKTSFSRCIIATKEAEKLKIEVEVLFDYRGREHAINLYRIFYD